MILNRFRANVHRGLCFIVLGGLAACDSTAAPPVTPDAAQDVVQDTAQDTGGELDIALVDHVTPAADVGDVRVAARDVSLDRGGDDVADAGTGCGFGETRCDGVCVRTSDNDLRCGACEGACGAAGMCVNGRCTPACTAEESDCGGCNDISTDPANCGA